MLATELAASSFWSSALSGLPKLGSTVQRGKLALSADWVSWRLNQGERVIAGSSDDKATIDLAIERINGAVFVSGELLPSGDSKLFFSGRLIPLEHS